MARKSKAVSDKIYKKALESLKRHGKQGHAGIRLQGIISARDHSITLVSKVLGVTRATLMKWIQNFEKDSDESLFIKPGRGRKPFIDPDVKKEIKKLILKDPNMTINHLKAILEETYNIYVSRSTVHRMMKLLELSYITPRPSHYNSDKNLQEEFKKKDKRNS
jgi:transposase